MLKFFGFGRTHAVQAPSAEPASMLPVTTQPHTHVQRELIRVVLKDTLRRHGIPAAWIGCEVIITPDSSGGEHLYVHLVIMKWNVSLLRFAPALQRQLMLGLDRFDPAVDHSNYMVLWRFAKDCGYPATAMPDASFWTQQTAAPKAAPALVPVSLPVPAPALSPAVAPAATPAAPPQPKFDLPASSRDNLQPDFAPTEPGYLHENSRETSR
jgi:hypothetical protein